MKTAPSSEAAPITTKVVSFAEAVETAPSAKARSNPKSVQTAAVKTASKKKAATAAAMAIADDEEIVVDWSSDGSILTSTNSKQRRKRKAEERKKHRLKEKVEAILSESWVPPDGSPPGAMRERDRSNLMPVSLSSNFLPSCSSAREVEDEIVREPITACHSPAKSKGTSDSSVKTNENKQPANSGIEVVDSRVTSDTE